MPPHLENNLIKMCICCKFVCESFETWFWERLNYQWEEDREVTTLSSYVRGHHVYKNVWDPWSEKHRLPLGVCQHSRSLCGGCHLNSHEPEVSEHSNAVMTVGHLQRKNSCLCSLFLLHGGTPMEFIQSLAQPTIPFVCIQFITWLWLWC